MELLKKVEILMAESETQTEESLVDRTRAIYSKPTFASQKPKRKLSRSRDRIMVF